MDPYLLGLIIIMLALAVGLSVFIGVEVVGLVRRITIDFSRTANVTGMKTERAGVEDEEIRPFPVYRDRRTVERLIEHFEEEPE
jgi:hypothetical protein